MSPTIFVCSAAVASTVVVSPASAADRDLVLEVIINGRPTGKVGEFIDRDGEILAAPSQMVELGFVLPDAMQNLAEPVVISTLPNVRASVDEVLQRLLIIAGDDALIPQELVGANHDKLADLSSSDFSLLLNYDASATVVQGHARAGALAEISANGPFGHLKTTGVVNLTQVQGQKRVVRLDTIFTATDYSKQRRWRFGDVIAAALPWSRAVRLGGLQIASDFALRPDLVTYPLPQVSGSADVPSTVGLMVNGVQKLNQRVEPGPFAFRSLPVVTGSGEIALTVTDLLGRQTLITMPFYASAALLRPGLISFSVEAGMVRENFSQIDDRYSGWAVSQSSRLGITDWLTIETHAEVTKRVRLLGGGFTALVGKFGIVNMAAAGSVDRGSTFAGARGAMISASFERTTSRYSIGASGIYSTSGYQDTAAEHGTPTPKALINARIGYELGRLGSLGITYTGQISRPQRTVPFRLAASGRPLKPHLHLVTGSYTVPIGKRAAFYGTVFKELSKRGSYGVSVGLTFSFGRATASAQGSIDGGRHALSAQLSRPAQKHGEFGYRARLANGPATRGSLEAEYLGSWGQVSAGVDTASGNTASRIGARGAVVFIDRTLLTSDRIEDSFAVVSTGNIADVPVLYENRAVGKTNGRGKLLIPSLLSYRNNKVSVDTTKLPPDVEVGQTWRLVRPSDRAGIVIDFPVRRVSAALLMLTNERGLAIPLGSMVQIEGAADRPVGHDGEAYVTGLKRINKAVVILPDGTLCSVQFEFTAVSGEIPLIGPLPCQ